MIKMEVEALKDEIIRLRRDIHQHPELGFNEIRTASLVADYLETLGLEVKTGVAETGVIGLLEGKHKGKTLLLRADMDALPIQEQSEVSYRSVYDGVMHACGHDGHVAMLLGTAKVLSARADKLKGNIKFAFQPAEEGGGGARVMIKEGLLKNPKVDAALALHLSTMLPYSHISLRAGPMMASGDRFQVTIKGSSGHAASPHFGTDAILPAAKVVSSLSDLVTKEISPTTPVIIHIGTISGGHAANIIAEKVEMKGTVRNLDPGIQDMIPGKMERVIKGITEAYGADYEFDYLEGYPVLKNDQDMTEFVKNTAGRILEPGNIIEMPPIMGSEDMAFILNKVPGCFFFIGARNDEKGITAPNHSSEFDIDEEALTLGCEVMVNLALAYLSSE